MPPTKKRKVAAVDQSEDVGLQTEVPAQNSKESVLATENTQDAQDLLERNRERTERFKALQARAKKSADRNLKEAAAESQRLATDPNLLSSLARKQAIASHKLLKADAAADGEDFERKRAWDWTIEESEKWDKRMEKKERHREDVAFQDYRQDARKIYKRQLRDMKPDTEAYEQEKADIVRKAALSGGLEIIETEDGELAAVDKSGTFYTTADSTEFAASKPDRAAVDRLVKDLQKAEDMRLRKRRARGKGDEEGDVTYINDKVSVLIRISTPIFTNHTQNKQFNQKLARFYNKVSCIL